MVNALLMGFMSGVVGTGLGGVIVALLRTKDERLPGLMTGFSGGIMLSIVICDMFPESFASDFTSGIIGAALGLLLLHTANIFMPGRDMSRQPGRNQNKHNTTKHNSNIRKANMRMAGLLMASGIALHNLPEGFAIGSGLASGPASMDNYGMQLAVLLMLHDIPEGVAMAVPLKLSGSGGGRVVISAVVAGIPTVIGAWLGYMMGSISEVLISGCIAFAGGAMLYITVKELIPGAMEMSGGSLGMVAISIGVLAGIGMVLII